LGIPIVHERTLPWDPKPPVTPEELDRYAFLCAHLARAPEQQGVILARHGISGDEALRRVHRRFAAHFQADPESGQRWRSLVASYRARDGSQGPSTR